MTKTALVTGAGGGLGAAIARRLAGEGYRVALLDLDAAGLEVEAARIPGALAFTADVTDEAQIDAVVAAMTEAFGDGPDLLVNNAGIVRFGDLLEHSVADFRRVVDVNLTGTFIVTRAVARRMAERGSGAIVNITSLNAVAPSPDAGAYPATKAAVALLTEHLALALAPRGVRVNAVAPGFIDAGMSAPIYADAEVRAVRGAAVPARSLGTADDVADAVLFLASDRARYIHGQHLMVDGGVSFSLKMHLPRRAPAVKPLVADR
ncbi:SDR family oxidoreductase [Azospirillum sp. A1-3]|uniref:SDR family NAD(P)-dependent oxidoreductase n=1 Tax=Azospirillum sp. A1-3 TaxID=185874 RepID=UPI002077746E|nr:SDR family NAD(P)-dependent oxidoreductase [Azospirillum sp. A1-3]MCM8735206.1 SDR family oxidoreductase [Azospirillum sp. A1-3]